MIFITLTIQEFEPGKVFLSINAPPGDASVGEVEVGERIRASINRAMMTSPGQVIKAQDSDCIDPSAP